MQTEHERANQWPAPQQGHSGSISSSPEGVQPAPPTTKPRRGKAVALLLILAFLSLLSWWAVKSRRATAAKSPAGGGRVGQMPPVPVVAGVVAQKDVPIFLDGLGTVQAFNTVTIRARVDGQIQKIAFTEGQDVHAGDLLAQIDPAPFRAQLEQAEAKKAEDEAQLTNARMDLQRNAELLSQKIVSQQIYDTQKALVNQLEASVKADQAAIENVRVQLQYTTIVSPIDGRTGIRLIDTGNIVHASDPNGFVVITQLRPISVVFTLPEQTLSRIHQHMSASDLPVMAVDRDNTTVLSEGRLAVIDNQIDTGTGTIRLKATFPNTDLHLWPGQFVNARLLLTIRKDSPVVPASVVQRGPEGAFAFVIKNDNTVEVRPIQVAQIEQGEALIEDGLTPGESVVVDGQYKLQRGSTVRTAESSGSRAPPNRSGGKKAGGVGKPAMGGERGPSGH